MDRTNFVFFWKPLEQNGWLSNWSPRPLIDNGIIFKFHHVPQGFTHGRHPFRKQNFNDQIPIRSQSHWTTNQTLE